MKTELAAGRRETIRWEVMQTQEGSGKGGMKRWQTQVLSEEGRLQQLTLAACKYKRRKEKLKFGF